jgi:CheY-like chemotaxis protein/HPt (histidine-containing phosphotransfer) domain-containing protein
MKDMLGSLGYDFELVSNGQEALDALAAKEYSLVLMDCQMPVLDGYTAARNWRRSELLSKRPRTPIVAVTAHALADEREKVLKAGMDDFLAKPVQVEPLRQMMAKWLKDATCFTPTSPPDQTEEQDQAPSTSSARRPSASMRAAARSQAGRVLLDPKTFRSPRMRELFLEHSRDDLEFVQEAAAVGDAVALGQRAHRLKGSSYAFGAQLLGDKAAEIEQLAKAGNVEVDQHVERLIALLASTNQELAKDTQQETETQREQPS